MEPGGEDRGFLGLAIRAYAAEDLDFAGFAFREEQVAIGSDPEQAGVVKAGGVEVDLEAFGCNRPGVGGTGND